MIHLKTVTFRDWDDESNNSYPFSLELVRNLNRLTFDSPVTFFVGENGSGKSTVLEALACAIGSVSVGSESLQTDETMAQARKLAGFLKLAWTKRVHRGFFLRAEDFFGYVKNIRQTQQYLRTEMVQMEAEAKKRSDFAAMQTRAGFQNELAGLQSSYGTGLDTRSHGEGYLQLFQSRFVPGGLYLLDEPEAALSPTRQMTFLAALKEMITQDSQFIIATHSPMILAFPEATILKFEDGVVSRVAYDDLEHVTLTREFLENPQAYIRYL